MEDMIRLLAAELGQKPQHVGAVVRLLDEGNTIPFIARYRKEQHGAMDDTTLRTLAERLQYLRNLAQRREEIRRSIAAQEKLTDEHMLRTVPIRQVVCSRPISYAGVEAIQYLCKTQLGPQEALLELRYTVRTHRWTLFRVVYGCPG